jgi:large subunit ribosomal protein L13
MSQAILKKTKTTHSSKIGYLRPWYIFDASKTPIGRIATEAARILIGKNRADYSPDVDMGGMVVVINAKQSVLTGKKPEKKNYFRHTGRIGSLKITSFAEQMVKDSTKPMYHAIRGMVPKNRHQDLRLHNRLFIFPESHNLTHKMIECN